MHNDMPGNTLIRAQAWLSASLVVISAVGFLDLILKRQSIAAFLLESFFLIVAIAFVYKAITLFYRLRRL